MALKVKNREYSKAKPKRPVKAKSDHVPKTLRISCQGHFEVDLDDMNPLQGDLKDLDEASYEKLRNSILEFGITFPFFVWTNKKKIYTLDGHQRDRVLKRMRDDEGFIIPPLPADLIEAENVKEAKAKIVLNNSRYGRMDEDSLAKFIKDSELNLEQIISTMQIPDIKLADLLSNFEKPSLQFEGGATITGEQVGENAPEPGVAVRMVQLFLDDNTLPIFTDHIEVLTAYYKTENLTDTVLTALNNARNQIKKKAS